MSMTSEMRSQFIRILKRRLPSYPQPFCSKFYPHTNCLAYAFGFKSPDFYHDIYFPGSLSGELKFLEKDLLAERLFNDLSLLDISCSIISKEEAHKRTQQGKQVVALFYSEVENDFHFIRKDKEGGWSHKPGYKSSPCKIRYNYEGIYDDTYELLAYMSASFK